jgi:hypothetical protein
MDFNEKIKTEIIPFLCKLRDNEINYYIDLINNDFFIITYSNKIKNLVFITIGYIEQLEFTILDYCQHCNMEVPEISTELKLKFELAQKKFADIESRKPYICSIILTLYKNMKKLFFIILIAFSFVQCTKTEQPTKEPCEVFNTGKGKIINLNPDPYLVYLDGKYIGRCEKNSTFEHDIAPSTYSLKAVQQSGYLIYPSEYVSSYNVIQCETTTITLK